MYSLPTKPSKQQTVDVCKTQSQLFSHRQQKGELDMLDNEIIKMISIILKSSGCFGNGTWPSWWHRAFWLPGCVSWSSRGKVPKEDQEDGWPSWPSQKDLVADAPSKLTGPGDSLLPLMSEEVLHVPGVHGFARAGFISKQFNPFFLWTWFGEDGGMREEPLPAQPEWEIKKLGFGEGGISLQGVFGFFQITDYRRLSLLWHSWNILGIWKAAVLSEK